MEIKKLDELIAKSKLPLKIVCSEEKGRYLVSTVPISRGECVLKETAYVCVVDDAKKKRVCNSCFQMSLDGEWSIHCQNCTRVYYCSPECEAKEKEYHALECDAFKKLDPTGFTQDGFESIKQAIRLFVYKKKNASRRSIGDTYIEFDTVETLSNHAELAITGEGPKVLEYLFQLLNVTDASDKQLLTWIYCTQETNTYFIRKGDIGRCLYTLSSFFSHSCAPTFIKTENENSMEFIATTDIPPDTEFSISYTNIHQDMKTRKSIMKASYCFECGCPRCLYETLHDTPYPLPESLKVTNCIDRSCSHFDKPLQPPSEKVKKLPYSVSLLCEKCSTERVDSHLYHRHPELDKA